ncbi:methyl-accepting chemotaxis protein [Thiomicrorhabdus arctica]|jgi:methyl-accepting chemotaxis protein|uniref:methyl-accepting chemotaxis protein n=1 Tax=Thiomicrorhabdus arctica TaxID=131540 RepID=UPI000362AD3C|nr:methyl-accepting chemotaxis protein [Thiomicrorhabdus arctica]
MENMEMDIQSLGSIVSKTDLNGLIIEVNDAFEAACGYTKNELIGQPHNIICHTDVPKELFKDLWKTLQAGKPWVQVVKNKRKDGGYYWVEVNATPILEDGSVVGYLSVSRAISSQAKVLTTQWYKEIQRGQKSISNGYSINRLQKVCLFNHFHPINLMLLMIGLLGSFAVLIQAGLVSLPVEWVAIVAVGFYGYAWAGKKYVFNRLGKAKVLMDNMRQGDFTGQVNFYGKHSLSKLVSAVKMMQVQLGAMYDDSQSKLNRSTRLKSALDSASANVMMVDKAGVVIYLNNELQSLFFGQERTFPSCCTDFSIENVVGAQLLEIFDKACFRELNNMQSFEETFGELTVYLKVKPVVNEMGEQIGTVIEWQDLTQQRSIESNLRSTLELASIGHTDLHIETENLSGFFLDTSNNINSLLAEFNAIIENTVFVMTKLATGDLRGRVDKDLQGSLAAMKGATNVSLDNLSVIVWYIKQATDTVRTAADKSSNTALDLSDRTQQAAASLEQINASMQMVHGLQKENTTELNAVHGLTSRTISENNNAKLALGATVNAIEEIQETSMKIANIISIIDGIAFQTNLLALNAAVEAARAGEHGRGFAVVAGEVRSLAQKSADAAKDIKKLIDASVIKVKEGVDKVQETNQAFEVVNESVTHIGSALSSVVLSIGEQQHSVTEIAQAISHLDQNIQSNAALVEETSAAAESLKQQAVLLNGETSKFQIDDSKAQDLTQVTPPLHGIRMSDVRQSMRIWRTNIQSYLNGINVVVDMEAAVDPLKSGVGKVLGSLIQSDSSIQALPEFIKAQELHQRQHKLVQDIILIKESKSSMTFDMLKEKDSLLDAFVTITNELDAALNKLNQSASKKVVLLAA